MRAVCAFALPILTRPSLGEVEDRTPPPGPPGRGSKGSRVGAALPPLVHRACALNALAALLLNPYYLQQGGGVARRGAPPFHPPPHLHLLPQLHT